MWIRRDGSFNAHRQPSPAVRLVSLLLSGSDDDFSPEGGWKGRNWQVYASPCRNPRSHVAAERSQCRGRQIFTLTQREPEVRGILWLAQYRRGVPHHTRLIGSSGCPRAVGDTIASSVHQPQDGRGAGMLRTGACPSSDLPTRAHMRRGPGDMVSAHVHRIKLLLIWEVPAACALRGRSRRRASSRRRCRTGWPWPLRGRNRSAVSVPH